MIIVRDPRAYRKWLALGLFGMLPLMGGCDDTKSDKPAPPADPAKQEMERKNREAAYGPGGSPNTKPGAAKAEPKPEAKAEPKPEAKAEEKPAPK